MEGSPTVKRGPGRPRKNPKPESAEEGGGSPAKRGPGAAGSPVKRGPGRPRKNPDAPKPTPADAKPDASAEGAPTKRPRGRPPKNPRPEGAGPKASSGETKAKRPRGRPPKSAKPADEALVAALAAGEDVANARAALSVLAVGAESKEVRATKLQELADAAGVLKKAAADLTERSNELHYALRIELADASK